MNKKWIVSLIAIATLGLAGFALTRPQPIDFKQERIPTLFFHGGGSSYRAEEHMVKAARDSGVTKTIIRANVTDEGQVTLIGELKADASNPIVEVNYENNLQMDYSKHGAYAIAVVKKLQEVYAFDQVKMVGHSFGNVSILEYMIQGTGDASLPKLVKQVDIAGHFAGLTFEGMPEEAKLPDGMTLDQEGKPSIMNETYQELSKARQAYPKGQVEVLNIIGDIGDGSDGSVQNISTLSLKYLVADRAKSYREEWIKGDGGQHSKLHENPEVDQLLIHFLWEKKESASN